MQHVGLIIQVYDESATLRMSPEWTPFMYEVAREAWGLDDEATIELGASMTQSHNWRDLDADQLRSLQYGAERMVQRIRSDDIARTRAMIPTDPPIEVHDNSFYAYIRDHCRNAAKELEFKDISVECPDCLHRFRPEGWEKR